MLPAACPEWGHPVQILDLAETGSVGEQVVPITGLTTLSSVSSALRGPAGALGSTSIEQCGSTASHGLWQIKIDEESAGTQGVG